MDTATARRHRLLIDTDLGIGNDDCLALLLALSSAQIAIEGVSVCAGNYSAKQCLMNALSTLDYLSERDIPVFAGTPLPLHHSYGELERRAFGKWGEVDAAEWPFSTPPEMTPRPIDAPAWLARRLRDGPPATLAAIGPLTNVALALRDGPLPALREIVIMGGMVEGFGSAVGNITPQAEFNFWVDPDAAEEVLQSGAPIRLIPQHIWAEAAVGLEHFAVIGTGDNPRCRLLATLLQDSYLADPGFSVSLGDAMAIGAVLWPELFEFRAATAHVVTRGGPEYGKLVLGEPDGRSTVSVAIRLDVAEAVGRFVRELTGASFRAGEPPGS